MKNKKLIITIILSVFITLAVVFAVLSVIKIYQNKLAESGYSETPNSANQYAKDVTMIQLIATPEKYDGQLVRVIGVGNLEFEGNCISLSKEDLKYGVGNSIWIDVYQATGQRLDTLYNSINTDCHDRTNGTRDCSRHYQWRPCRWNILGYCSIRPECAPI